MSADIFGLARDIAATGPAAVAKAERAALAAVAAEQAKTTADLFEDVIGAPLPDYIRAAADRADAAARAASMGAHPTARPKLTLHQGGADQ